MFAQLKSYLLAATITLTASSLAASPIFYTGDDTGVVIVGFDASQNATIKLDAGRLLDARDLIRISYGTIKLDTLLRVKLITAPKGITVGLDDSSLSVQNDSNELKIVFEVSNDHAETGSFQVVVTLENVETGATTAVTLMVQVQ